MQYKNAPLQEVIFEAQWELPERQTGPVDPDFENAKQRIQDLLRDEFSHVVDVSLKNLVIVPRPTVQLWKGDGVWPVIQVGEGIVSVNMTKEYDWDTFEPLIQRVLDVLDSAYGKEHIYVRCGLRYIDSVRMADHSDTTVVQEFINEKFKLSITTGFDDFGTAHSLALQQIYKVGRSDLLILLNNGRNIDGESTMMWQSNMILNEPVRRTELTQWLDMAHLESRKVFSSILNPDFYESFK